MTDDVFGLKEYGFAMGRHCQQEHGGQVAVHVDCAECQRLVVDGQEIQNRLIAQVCAVAAKAGESVWPEIGRDPCTRGLHEWGGWASYRWSTLAGDPTEQGNFRSCTFCGNQERRNVVRFSGAAGEP